jgi:hypothetical protein
MMASYNQPSNLAKIGLTGMYMADIIRVHQKVEYALLGMLIGFYFDEKLI